MKQLYVCFIIMTTLGLGNTSYTGCMDVESMQDDLSNQKVSISAIPSEVFCNIISKLPMNTYFAVWKVMKLRQVCSRWNELLTEEFIVNSANQELRSSKDHYRAIMGKGLAARLHEFCHITLFDEDQSKKVAKQCITEAFSKMYLPDVDHKRLFDTICRIIRRYNITPTDILIMHDFNGFVDNKEKGPRHMHLLAVCLEAAYPADVHYKQDIFNLLLPQLDLSNRLVLDVIAKEHDPSIVLLLVSAEYRDQLDACYLFQSLVKQSSNSLTEYYGHSIDKASIEQTGLAQLVRLCLNRGITIDELLRIVKNQQHKNIESYLLYHPGMQALFELEKNKTTIEEVCQTSDSLKFIFTTWGKEGALTFRDTFYLLEKLMLQYRTLICSNECGPKQ